MNDNGFDGNRFGGGREDGSSRERYEGESPLPGSSGGVEEPRPTRHNYILHIGLFLATFLSVTYTMISFGVNPSLPADVLGDFFALMGVGLPFSVLLLLFLTVHEFGHYFAARAHGVDVTLPFYIPMPFILFGTLGAVIRTRAVVPSRKAMFDIGVAGPLAGFVVALAYLIIGIATMPGIDSLYHFHPEYRAVQTFPDKGIFFGGFALFSLLREAFIEPGRFFPPMNEIYHYPFLCVGWFGMFVTSLNMIPVGQLDGGHIVYSMFGRRQKLISQWVMRGILFIGLGTVGALLLDAVKAYNPDPLYRFFQGILGPVMLWIEANAGWWFLGWGGWLFWYIALRFLVKVEHPPVPDETPLDRRRMVIGWISLVVFALTFSYTGIYMGADPDPVAAPAPSGPAAELLPSASHSSLNCTSCSFLYSRPASSSSAWVPHSTISPSWTTAI